MGGLELKARWLGRKGNNMLREGNGGLELKLSKKTRTNPKCKSVAWREKNLKTKHERLDEKFMWYRRGAEMQKYLIKKRNQENGTCKQGELFKNLNYEECCRDRTEKENEMWETSLCSHSSSSLHLSEPEVLSQHLWNPLAQQLLLPPHEGTQGSKHLTHR